MGSGELWGGDGSKFGSNGVGIGTFGRMGIMLIGWSYFSVTYRWSLNVATAINVIKYVRL